jgi:hypothetical protein
MSNTSGQKTPYLAINCAPAGLAHHQTRGNNVASHTFTHLQLLQRPESKQQTHAGIENTNSCAPAGLPDPATGKCTAGALHLQLPQCPASRQHLDIQDLLGHSKSSTVAHLLACLIISRGHRQLHNIMHLCTPAIATTP